MSNISERNYAAGWMSDVGYDLWDLVEGAPNGTHGYDLWGDELSVMQEMSRLINGWTDIDGEYIPLAEWRVQYAEHRQAQRDALAAFHAKQDAAKAENATAPAVASLSEDC